MAFRFDVEGDRLTITQRRKGARIALWLLAVFGVVGIVIQLIPRDPRHGGPPPPLGIAVGAAGVLAMIAIVGAFCTEAETIVDRAAGTIVMRGRKWPLRRWSIERPIAEVDRVITRRIYAGRGQYVTLVDVVFGDDTTARAMSPAAYRPARLAEQIETLRAFLGRVAPAAQVARSVSTASQPIPPRPISHSSDRT